MTTAETLRAARELIADPEHWCQGASARDRNGQPVEAEDAAAVAWCAHGACRRVMPVAHSALRHLGDAALATGSWCVSALNDDGTHADVLAMFDHAIEEAE